MELGDVWILLDQARAAGASASERVAELERLLARKPPAEVEEFARIQRGLMRDSYRWDLWGAAYVINGGCSDDCFDYFRGWLLMQGREIWDAAMRDPESLADVQMDQAAECEDAIYVADKAFEAITGRALPAEPAQKNEPAGQKWDEDDLPSIYPRLWKRFGAQPSTRPDVWDQEMSMAMSALANGRYGDAAAIFTAIRKGAPRPLTRTLAANNLAWTQLMIDSPAATQTAQAMASEARQEIETAPERDRFVGAVDGTLAFALIKQGQVDEGLALIEDVLLTTPSESSLYATRLCIKAIGLAKSGNLKRARALVVQARGRDPRCQLLGQARAAVSARTIPLPAVLANLEPLLARFGISDDVEREHVIEAASAAELDALVRDVTPDAFAAINRFLDETDNAEHAASFGDLAQAAVEAKLELKRRGV